MPKKGFLIKKIISGGQTGADQGALDAAMELGIEHGGWIPKGRKTEKGPLPACYNLKEMPTADYAQRTRQNVLDSDGTLIISNGALTGGSALTRELAEKYHRPWFHADMLKLSVPQAAEKIRSWIRENNIEVLNVAGPRASNDANIHDLTFNILKTVLSPQE